MKSQLRLSTKKRQMSRTDNYHSSSYVPLDGTIVDGSVDAGEPMSFTMTTGSESPYKHHRLTAGSEICTFIQGSDHGSDSVGSPHPSSVSEIESKSVHSDSNLDSDAGIGTREDS